MYKERARKKPWVIGYTPLPDRRGKAVLSPLHYGDTIEILMIRGIEGTMTVNGKSFPLNRENVLFIPPRQLHNATFLRGGSSNGDVIAALHITPELLLPYIDLTGILIADHLPLTSIPTVCGHFERIYDLAMRLVKTELLLDGICILLRLIGILSAEPIAKPEALAYDRHTARIVEFVESNYAHDLTVESAAAAFGYHPHYFCKWIKQHTGTTFNSFLNAVRINHASADLHRGYSCARTAERCGYKDPSYFVKVFKRIMGMTPKEYAQQNASSIHQKKTEHSQKA